MKVKVAVCGNESRMYRNVGLKDEGPYRLSEVKVHSTHGHARDYAASTEERLNKVKPRSYFD